MKTSGLLLILLISNLLSFSQDSNVDPNTRFDYIYFVFESKPCSGDIGNEGNNLYVFEFYRRGEVKCSFSNLSWQVCRTDPTYYNTYGLLYHAIKGDKMQHYHDAICRRFTSRKNTETVPFNFNRQTVTFREREIQNNFVTSWYYDGKLFQADFFPKSNSPIKGDVTIYINGHTEGDMYGRIKCR